MKDTFFGSTVSADEALHASDTSIVDETFQILNDKLNNIYQFVMLYNEYIYARHDYGTGIPMSMIEAHTLTYIEDHPGTTVSFLARYWNKTKGALSQIVSKLEKQGLVAKNKDDSNAKTIHLYVTEDGKALSRAHKMYDILDITKTMSKLQNKCTMEEIETFYKVIAVYNEIIKEDFDVIKK